MKVRSSLPNAVNIEDRRNKPTWYVIYLSWPLPWYMTREVCVKLLKLFAFHAIVLLLYRQSKLKKKQLTTRWTLLTDSLPILVINTLINCWGYAIVGITSIAFVLWNGGVVVGDKSAHEASFNPPQLGYFACFTLGLSLPYLVSVDKGRRFLADLWTNKLLSFLTVAISVALVYCCTQVHPYLLADNRHYPFYLWSKLLGKYFYARYALVPVYMFSFWSMNDSLRHIHWMVRCSLWVCVCAALIPQKLLEFRYFVVPYILIRCHMQGESWKGLLFELFVYSCINVFTFYIYLYKPIFWPHIHEPQRIMW